VRATQTDPLPHTEIDLAGIFVKRIVAVGGEAGR
jgi:hypothetical protein